MVDKLEGANPPELAHKVARHLSHPLSASLGSSSKVFMDGGAAPNDIIESVLAASRAAPPGSNSAAHSFGSAPLPVGGPTPTAATGKKDAFELTPGLKERLQALISSHPIVLFMKGSPEAPQCGFSSRVVAALEKEIGRGAFGHFDILTDGDVRQGLKILSDWPTFPQLYVGGELIGGCDIVMQMHSSGELKDVLAEAGVQKGNQEKTVQLREDAEPSDDELRALVNSAPTMLFMKVRRSWSDKTDALEFQQLEHILWSDLHSKGVT